MARVAFCQDTLVEYMGFMQMAAVLRTDGHVVEIFIDDYLNAADFTDELAEFRPDVVAFSVLTPSRDWAIETATAARARTGAATICGNVDAILNPSAFVPDGAFDLICTGEGEGVLTELCLAIDSGASWENITGTWRVRPDTVIKNPDRSELVDMDKLPTIDRSVYDKYRFFRRSPYLRVYAGRGCPFRCSFCSNTTMTDAFGGAKTYMRKRSPDLFVQDLVDLIEARPNRIKRIFFIDEVLWFDRTWLHDFLTLYRDRVGIPFSMNFKFNGGVTEADIELMAAAGAKAVCVASETGDEAIRRGVMNKPVSNAHILEVTRWMHKYGIEFGCSTIFGLPGQSYEGHIAELEFFREVKPHYLGANFFQPYPGLQLTEQLEGSGAFTAGGSFESTTHKDMYLDLPDRTRLVNIKKAYFVLYRFPFTQRPLTALARYRVPLLFDLIFLSHFVYYALWAEGCSLRQFATHFRNIAIKPALRRKQSLHSTGRPFDPGYKAVDDESQDSTAGPPAPAPGTVQVRLSRR